MKVNSYGQREFGLDNNNGLAVLTALGLLGGSALKLRQAKKLNEEAKESLEKGDEDAYRSKEKQVQKALYKSLGRSIAATGLSAYRLNKLGAFDPIKSFIRSKLG